MREAQNISTVEALGIDWMGLIFYPPSSRYVTEVPGYLPRCKRVGVFVDADLDFIARRVTQFGLNLVQLHGNESPDFCKQIRTQFPGLGIIKVFSIRTIEELQRTAQYEGLADYFLFDTFCKEKGGSGRMFDHSILNSYKGNTPFLLSGGLSLENMADIQDFSHPCLHGYDLNSRFEISPALKDADKLREFINQIRKQEIQ